MNALDKEEFRIKLEEINKLIEKKDYESAMDIVDSIDWRKVKNIRTLCVVGEIYAANKRYEESKEIFLLAYHRAPIGKTILYRLIEVSLRMGDVKEAEEFYEEYKNIAPKDTSCYVLQYKILRVKKAPIEKQIEILEEYKEKEFTEKWSFELAKLYYKIGEREKSLEVCDDLILWFSEGKYVTKALDLKLRMGAISQSEREKYEKQFIPKLITPEEAAVVKEEVQDAQSENSEEELSVKAGEIEKIKIKQEAANAGVGGIVETTGVLQEKIAKGIKDIFSGIHKERKEEELFDQRLEEDSQVSDETSELEQEMKPQEVVDDIEKSVDVEEAPPLESEKLLEEQQKEEENFIEKTEDSEEKPDIWNEPLKMPELKIPDRIKLSNQIEAPKAKVIPEFVLPTDEELAKQQEEQKEEESKDLNLEDMILAAASEQGIEVPEDYEDAVKKETVDEEELSEFSDMDSSEEETVEETVEADVEPEQEVFAGREKESYADKPESEDYEESDLEDDGLELEQFNLDEELSREREEFVASLEVDDSEEETEKEDSLVVEASNQDLKREPQDWDNENNREEDIEVLDDILVDTDTEIVPRKMAFDDEEEKLFTYFVKIPGMKEQILDALLDVQLSAADKTSKSGNVIVMGNRGCGKTRLI
ncbi:tetratricopeptide repeat protein, partial [Blautia hydrogenotrophica]